MILILPFVFQAIRKEDISSDSTDEALTQRSVKEETSQNPEAETTSNQAVVGPGQTPGHQDDSEKTEDLTTNRTRYEKFFIVSQDFFTDIRNSGQIKALELDRQFYLWSTNFLLIWHLHKECFKRQKICKINLQNFKSHLNCKGKAIKGTYDDLM